MRRERRQQRERQTDRQRQTEKNKTDKQSEVQKVSDLQFVLEHNSWKSQVDWGACTGLTMHGFRLRDGATADPGVPTPGP